MNSNVKTANRIPVAFWTAVLLACMVGSSALADDQLRSETVSFQDLNVDTLAGAQALYGRIHSAARRVCAETGADPLFRIAESVCASKTEAQAIAKVNRPQLTAYYEKKTGKHTQPLSASR